MKLRDSSVDGGDPVFVTFEVGAPEDARSLTISPGLVLRKEDRDVHTLVARTPELESYAPIDAPGATMPPISLAAGTEYRFDLPDTEPGFHQLCATYSIDAQPGRVCAELALG